MLPLVVEKTMDKLCISLRENNVKIESVYMHGSIALGDFIAIVEEPYTMSDIEAISAAHQEVENEFPHTDITGAYLIKSDIGKPQGDISSLE